MQEINWDFTTTPTLVIFCLTYAGIAAGHVWGLTLDRTAITMLGAIAMLSFGILFFYSSTSNTFAGNLFLIGSVANLIVVQGAAKYGIKISFWQFAKYGIPVAVSSFKILLGWIVIVV